MKKIYLTLCFYLSGCQGEANFPEEPPIIIDPVGPSRIYNEKIHGSSVIDYESVNVMKCRRSVYVGKNGKYKTVLRTQHCVDKDRGWFHAGRHIDEDNDGIADKNCILAGESLIGGKKITSPWNCSACKKALEEILLNAEGWLKDPGCI